MSELILYTTEDGASRTQLRGQTVWLTQAELAGLSTSPPKTSASSRKTSFQTSSCDLDDLPRNPRCESGAAR